MGIVPTWISDSLNLRDFTVEELMTSVRDSGLYSGTEVDQRVLECFKAQENILKAKNSEIVEKDSKITMLRRDLFFLEKRYRKNL